LSDDAYGEHIRDIRAGDHENEDNEDPNENVSGKSVDDVGAYTLMTILKITMEITFVLMVLLRIMGI